MGDYGFFSHDDAYDGDLEQRLSMGARKWVMCGENILREKGYGEPAREAVRVWMNSPHHRANILNPAFTKTGIGVALGRDNFLYFTQDFMR